MIQGNQLVGFREGKNLAQLFPRHQHFSCFTVNIGIFSKIGRRQSAWFLPPLISPRHQIVLIRLPFILTQKQIVLSRRQIVLHWKPFVLPRKQSVSSQKPFVLTQKQIVLRRNQIVLRWKPFVLPRKQSVLIQKPFVLTQKQIVLRRNQIVLRWKPFVLPRQQSVLSQKPFGLSWKHFILTSQQMILLPIRKQICPLISPIPADGCGENRRHRRAHWLWPKFAQLKRPT